MGYSVRHDLHYEAPRARAAATRATPYYDSFSHQQ